MHTEVRVLVRKTHVPVSFHGLAVTSPRRLELDEYGLARGQFIEVGIGKLSCGNSGENTCEQKENRSHPVEALENNWLNLAGPHPRSTAAAFTTKAPRLCRFEVRVFVHKSHRSTTDYSKCRLGTRLGFGVWPRRTEASHVSQPLPFSAELPRILAQRGPRWKPGAGRSSKHTSPACPVRVAHLQE